MLDLDEMVKCSWNSVKNSDVKNVEPDLYEHSGCDDWEKHTSELGKKEPIYKDIPFADVHGYIWNDCEPKLEFFIYFHNDPIALDYVNIYPRRI